MTTIWTFLNLDSVEVCYAPPCVVVNYEHPIPSRTTTEPHVTHHCTSAASYSLCLCCAVAQVVCGWKSLRLRRLHFYFLRLRWKSLRLRRLRRLRLFRVWVWGRLWLWCVASMFVGCVGRFRLPSNVSVLYVTYVTHVTHVIYGWR